MSEAMISLSHHIDSNIPYAFIFCVTRSISLKVLSQLLKVFKWTFIYRTSLHVVKLVFLFLNCVFLILTIYTAFDFYQNADDVTTCKVQSTPRPIGVAAL